MKFMKLIKFNLSIICFLVVLSMAMNGEATAATYYVATNGKDSNSGSIDSPWATIQKAADTVSAGDTVIVKDGTYTDTNSDNYVLIFNSSGDANNWITFKSENKWGAILDGNNTAGICIGAYKYHHVIIDGFDIKRCDYGIHTNSGAHDIQVINNDIHDMAVHCNTPPKNSGGMGIDIGSNNQNATYNWTIDSNRIHDIGAPVTCSYRNTSNDYGIYSGGYNLTITNNIFYNNYAGWDIHIPRTCATEYDGDNFLVSNNTFYVDASSDYSGTIILWNYENCGGTNFSNFRIQNNISYNPKSNRLVYIYSNSISGIDITNNLINVGVIRASSNPSYTPGTETGNITGQDPKFTNLSGRNFYLQANSPVINAGLATNAPTTDFDRNARPQGGAYDIGAYEYVGAKVADNTPPAAPKLY